MQTLGYRTENGEIVVDYREMQILEIVEREHRQGKGPHDIARTLNEGGYKNRRGKPFTAQLVNHYRKKLKAEP